MNHVAIFSAYWLLHSNVVYMAAALANDGYKVDLFLLETDERFTEDALNGQADVTVHRLGRLADYAPEPAIPPIRSRPVQLLQDLAFKVRWRLRKVSPKAIRERFWPETTIMPPPVLEETARLMRGKKYKAFVGVEKGGLVWAHLAAKSILAPVFYYSLELYARNDDFCRWSDLNRRLKLAEEKCHKCCHATIIQDEHRAKALLSYNRVRRDMRCIYLPISRLEKPGRVESSFLRDRFGLPGDTVLVLVLGLMEEFRFSPQLAGVAQVFPENWRLIFHGHGPAAVIQRVRETDRCGRVLLSLDQVPNDALPRVVSSATIGLVLYSGTLLTDRLSAFSGEKIALCLQSGLPIVAFRYEGYEFVEGERCGILINSLEEVPQAVRAILEAYNEYHSNALASFQRHFVFEKNVRPLLEEIRPLPCAHRG
jgi:hypothetical protein